MKGKNFNAERKDTKWTLKNGNNFPLNPNSSKLMTAQSSMTKSEKFKKWRLFQRELAGDGLISVKLRNET